MNLVVLFFLRFVVITGVVFSLLVCYESVKKGGFDKRWSKTIVIFSIACGVILAFGVAGWDGR